MAALGKLHCSFAANDERQQWAVHAPLKTEEISVTVMKATQESFIAATERTPHPAR
jgi:hypothetical protein